MLKARISLDATKPPYSVSVKEAAGLIGCCRQTVLNDIHRGRLPAFIIGENTYRIKKEDLNKFMEGQR